MHMDAQSVFAKSIAITNIAGIRVLGGVDTGLALSAGALPLLHIAGR